ncbi:glycosyltransferase [Amycolatopsis sp. OK19-0408]|uniref:Glycosyltransferase n=1 Tax=Amycolatopsis iheyensis TaxID=2945988 RepID=A0A9X2NJ40_9PSEU|nr:glycosyltransferase [Amycolatopsis iheyensis]MCR6488772.1 glycosyltransferase [Amycolatopsis iheyensis]
MRIVFSGLPGYGHIYPLLPLALAAREAGHDVAYATDPMFHPVLHRIGIPAIAAGMPIREAFATVFAGQGTDFRARPWPDWLEPSVRVFGDVLPRRFAADLLPTLKADLVVYEASNPGAGLAARKLGIPALCHAIARAEAPEAGLDGYERLADHLARAATHPKLLIPWAIAANRWRRTGLPLLRAVAAEIGVELAEDDYELGDRYLDVFPASLQEPSFVGRPERLPLRPTPFTEPGELPAIALAERKRPLVYLTLGTVVGTAPALRAAIDELSTMDVEVLVAAGENLPVADLGELPPNVHLERWVPQAELLPLVDLAVHHGGSGTTLAAAAAGVPQLLLPVGFDGFVNAGAVAAAGAGTRLFPGESIAEAAAGLLGGARPTALAEEIAAMPSPEDIVARLPEG